MDRSNSSAPGLLVLFVLAMVVLVVLYGCQAPAAEIQVHCLPMIEYSPGQQSSLQAEYHQLPASSILRTVVQDYLKLRDANRACLGVPPPGGPHG